MMASPAGAANYIFDITPSTTAAGNAGPDPTMTFTLDGPITGDQGWLGSIPGRAAVSSWPGTGPANGGLVGFFGYDYAGRDGHTLRLGEGSLNDHGLYPTSADPSLTT